MDNETLDDYLEKKGLTKKELNKIIKVKSTPQPKLNQRVKLDTDSKTVYFGVISDTHMGHNKYRPDVLKHAKKKFDAEGIEFILHAGDICEGMSGRDGHIYELQYQGASNQLDYATEQLSQFEQPMYGITANDSHDGWFHSKANMGLDVGTELERRLPNFNFIGNDEADVITDAGMMIRLVHPGGGTAYAISYKAQKYANSLSGGQKPHLVFEGHYHKALYMFYRNMHMFEAGCLEDQTIFMKKQGTPAMVGYWIIKATGTKKGVTEIEPKFIPFYE